MPATECSERPGADAVLGQDAPLDAVAARIDRTQVAVDSVVVDGKSGEVRGGGDDVGKPHAMQVGTRARQRQSQACIGARIETRGSAS